MLPLRRGTGINDREIMVGQPLGDGISHPQQYRRTHAEDDSVLDRATGIRDLHSNLDFSVTIRYVLPTRS